MTEKQEPLFPLQEVPILLSSPGIHVVISGGCVQSVLAHSEVAMALQKLGAAVTIVDYDNIESDLEHSEDTETSIDEVAEELNKYEANKMKPIAWENLDLGFDQEGLKWDGHVISLQQPEAPK